MKVNKFILLIGTALAAVAVLAACAPATGTSMPAPSTAVPPAIPPANTMPTKQVEATQMAPSNTAASPATSLPPTKGTYAPVIDPANFVTKIDNPFLPMVPGTTMIYEGPTEKGNEHDEVQVSSDTKVIMGVTCVVVNDMVKVDGKLEEGTVDWFAQDKQGNVWYFGEDSKDYDTNGKVTSTQGSWLGGVNGALPGIVMKANPVVGDTYRQEYLKGQAEDWASVLSLSESLTVPTGSYTNMLMTNEWSDLDNPRVYEHKYYARGIGFIETKYTQGGYDLKLIEIRHP